ncbi:hypothetical protein L484_018695 [Morus notabilis]|uniref:Phosphotyrosine protein phosphatase domain-containing protein n=1 Tax=Morus notabilis TaxID=981085 RepID=W9RZB0_9ROSA|nr:hypothetical protein L484_018695 [Morus notabilis]
MPQVIVIDEIGTKLEAMAASTIAQRGIQLVATAHGVTIKNLIMNPSLEMLVGGIQSVTLGDEEASRRGVQKSVLERKGPATFSCAVEIVSKTELRVHRSLETTVDAILAGRFPNVEVRKIKSNELEDTLEREPFICNSFDTEDELMDEEAPELIENGTYYKEFTSEVSPNMGEASGEGTIPLRLFVYGILEASVIQGIKQLKIDDAAICLTNNISEADALLALQSKLKKNPRIQAAVKSHNIPIYMTKTSSLVQIRKAIRALMSDHEDGLNDLESVEKVKSSEKTDALEKKVMQTLKEIATFHLKEGMNRKTKVVCVPFLHSVRRRRVRDWMTEKVSWDLKKASKNKSNLPLNFFMWEIRKSPRQQSHKMRIANEGNKEATTPIIHEMQITNEGSERSRPEGSKKSSPEGGKKGGSGQCGLDGYTHRGTVIQGRQPINARRGDEEGEARLAIEQVVIPKGEPAELLPRPTRIMTLQLDLIRRYQLEAERIGSGAETRLCILPLHVRKNEEDDTKQNDMSVSDSELDDFVNSKGNTNVSPYCVDRLPLLPE